MRERSLWIFITTTLVLAALPMTGIVRFDHLQLHLAANSFHSDQADLFFSIVTHLADGWVPTVISLLLLWHSWRAFLMMGLSCALSAIITQTLKRTLFSWVDRPFMFLDAMPDLHLVPGVELNHHFSFPSGHSTAAFSMCLAAAVLIAKPGQAVLWILLAATLGFSRIYLSQHFTEDVLAGAMIGTITACGVWYLLFQGPLSGRMALDRSPFRRGRNPL